MKLSRIGIDLAKNIYQLHGVDRHGKTVWKRRLRRGQWLQALFDKTEPGCEIGMARHQRMPTTEAECTYAVVPCLTSTECLQ